jgi:S23 ribosomal protein.
VKSQSITYQKKYLLSVNLEQYCYQIISTPLASELSNRITSQYSTIIQFFDPPVNSQLSTVNNNSGATGIDITKHFPQSELYGLTSQIRSSAVSVASNIAEGYGRQSKNEYK